MGASQSTYTGAHEFGLRLGPDIAPSKLLGPDAMFGLRLGPDIAPSG